MILIVGHAGAAETISLVLADFKPSKGPDAKRSIWPHRPKAREHLAHPNNAPGPFYSENEGCITCGAPSAEAPELIGWHEGPCTKGRLSHCIFRRQPETPKEVERAIRAMDVSCVANLRYRGTDPAILKRLLDMGNGHLCDAYEHE